jgi:hypothetical protein
VIPAAIVAVVTAVAGEHPLATPEELGRLVVTALADDGWQVTPEPERAPFRSELAPGRRARPALSAGSSTRPALCPPAAA